MGASSGAGGPQEGRGSWPPERTKGCLILALCVCCIAAKSLAFSDLGITFSNTSS